MVLRTEQIRIKRHKDSISHYTHISKNLWNEANYAIRQQFFRDGKRIRYIQLNQMFKCSDNYKGLSAQTSQQILKVLDRTWTAYFRATKQYEKRPDLFLGAPRIPRYKKKDGEFMLVFTNQQCRIKDSFLKFPKRFNMRFKVRLEDDTDLREVRIIPKGGGYALEIIYDRPQVERHSLNKDNIIGIDYGLTNIVTIANNIGIKPIVVKGGAIKSINQYYNKHRARLQSVYDRQGIKDGTKMTRLTHRRNNKMKDAMHKLSRLIVDYCVTNDIGTIVIGHNRHWKQNITLGRRNNQNFVSIPYYLLTRCIGYKAEHHGIDVKLQDEAHTSKCSFVDDEPVRHHKEYVGKRIKRGLFRTRLNHLINADVNAGLNIIKKSNPEAFNHMNDITGRDIGTGLVPFRCSINQKIAFNRGVCYQF